MMSEILPYHIFSHISLKYEKEAMLQKEGNKIAYGEDLMVPFVHLPHSHRFSGTAVS